MGWSRTLQLIGAAMAGGALVHVWHGWTSPTAPLATPTARPVEIRDTPAGELAVPRAALPHPVAPVLPAVRAPDSAPEDLSELRARLQTLERELVSERTYRRAQEGEPRPFPSDLDVKFREAAVVESVLQALQTGQLDGQVVAADCTEYPCIVYGEVMGSPNQWGKLKEALEGQAAYQGMDRASYSWGVDVLEPNGAKGKRMHFATSWMPSDDPWQDSERRRFEYRTSQMKDALRPPGYAADPD